MEVSCLQLYLGAVFLAIIATMFQLCKFIMIRRKEKENCITLGDALALDILGLHDIVHANLRARKLKLRPTGSFYFWGGIPFPLKENFNGVLSPRKVPSFLHVHFNITYFSWTWPCSTGNLGKKFCKCHVLASEYFFWPNRETFMKLDVWIERSFRIVGEIALILNEGYLHY